MKRKGNLWYKLSYEEAVGLEKEVEEAAAHALKTSRKAVKAAVKAETATLEAEAMGILPQKKESEETS